MKSIKQYVAAMSLALVGGYVQAQHIDEAIFGGQLEKSFQMTFSAPQEKGSGSDSYFAYNLSYLEIPFDTAIINLADDQKTRKNIALASEGKCDAILEKYFSLIRNLRKARGIGQMEATKTYTLGDMLLIPSEEISLKGIKSSSAIYVGRKDHDKCRIDFHINP